MGKEGWLESRRWRRNLHPYPKMERREAILGSDDARDVMPSQVEGVGLPVHQLALLAMGLHIFDNCDLEQLSKEAAKRNRWEFMLTTSPMAIVGGTGSPLNPIATF